MPKRISASFLRSLTALLLVVFGIGVCYAKFPAYLSNYRLIQAVTPYRQNYVVLDDQILSNSRHDLGDLRLFAEFQEIPFELVTERGDYSLGHADAKILSKERVGSDTQLVLDITGLPQCDQVDLSLADSARDFVAGAQIEGLRSPTDHAGVSLGSSVLFDFSHEGLGSGSTIKFATTRDPYLRVRLTKLTPDQILQAIAINSRLGNPIWTPLGGELPVRQEGQTTVVTWDASVETPVMRVAFKVDPSQTNFWRDVQVLTLGGGTITNRSVRRIHLVRDGKLAQSEWLDFPLPGEEWGPFQLVFENGDEPPLKITSARAYAYERRLYFYPKGQNSLALFYGNSSLVAPDYVHSQPQSNTGEADAVATLGPDMRNPEHVPGASETRPQPLPGPGQLGGGISGGIMGRAMTGTFGLAEDHIGVSASLQARSLVNRVMPKAPAIGDARNVTGTIVLHAVIAKDGSVEELEYVSGPPMLVKAAMDAAKQWRYKATTLNGDPVEVDTTIEVPFPPSTHE